MLCLNTLTRWRCPLGPPLLQERPICTIRNGWGKFCSIEPNLDLIRGHVLVGKIVGKLLTGNSSREKSDGALNFFPTFALKRTILRTDLALKIKTFWTSHAQSCWCIVKKKLISFIFASGERIFLRSHAGSFWACRLGARFADWRSGCGNQVTWNSCFWEEKEAARSVEDFIRPWMPGRDWHKEWTIAQLLKAQR